MSIDFTGTHTNTSKIVKVFLVLFFVLDIFSNGARPGPGPYDCPLWSNWPQQVQHGEVWKWFPDKHISKSLFMETRECNYLCLSGTKQLWNTRRLITLSTFQWLLQCTSWVCLNCTCNKLWYYLGWNSIEADCCCTLHTRVTRCQCISHNLRNLLISRQESTVRRNTAMPNTSCWRWESSFKYR